jgi:hypothetical protein
LIVVITSLAMIVTSLAVVVTSLAVVVTGFAMIVTSLAVVVTGFAMIFSGFAVVVTGFAMIFSGFAVVVTSLAMIFSGFAMIVTCLAVVVTGLAGMVIIVIAVAIIPLIIARFIRVTSRQKDASRHDPMSICTIGYNVAIAGYGNTTISSTLRIYNQTMSILPLSLNNLLLTVIRHRQVAPGSTHH